MNVVVVVVSDKSTLMNVVVVVVVVSDKNAPMNVVVVVVVSDKNALVNVVVVVVSDKSALMNDFLNQIKVNPELAAMFENIQRDTTMTMSETSLMDVS